MRTSFTPILILIATLLCGADGFAQSEPSSAGLTGTSYLIAFPPSDPEGVHQFHGLVITSQVATNGTIVIPIVPSSPLETITEYESRPFVVSPDQPTFIPLPRSLEPIYSDESSRRVVQLTSRAPVSVSVMNARRQTSGVYRVLPTTEWGTSYLPTTVGATWSNDLGITSQLMIIGSEDDTEVTIRPSAKTTFHQVGQQINITLNKGEVYLLQADARHQIAPPRDLSGSSISATAPVGVVSGHVRTAIGADPTSSVSYRTQFGSWIASMETPERDWGSEYLSSPSRPVGGDRYRVVARSDRTSLTATLFADGVTYSEQFDLPYRGEVIDISTVEGRAITGPVKWSSSKPVSVTQLRLTGGNYTDTDHSPALHHLEPIEEFGHFASFGLPYELEGETFDLFELTVVTIGGDINADLLVDGSPIGSIPGATVIPVGGEHFVVKLDIASGSHQVEGRNGLRFSARVRGSNGPIAATVLDYMVPTWVPAIDMDIEAPRLLDVNRITERQVSLMVSDRTESYFSGVAKIEVIESPGWELVGSSVSPDPDVDASASFRVRDGFDPSGALMLRLTDRDGNVREVVAVENICFSTAYLDRAEISLKVTRGATDEQQIYLEASPCGDVAELTWIGWDLDGSATPYLEELDLGPLPLTISAYDRLPIVIRVKETAPVGSYATTLELIVDGKTKLMRLNLTVEPASSVSTSARFPALLDIE